MTMDTRQRAESLYAEGQWKEAERLFAGLMAEGQVDGNLLHDHAVCIFQLGRKKPSKPSASPRKKRTPTRRR